MGTSPLGDLDLDLGAVGLGVGSAGGAGGISLSDSASSLEPSLDRLLDRGLSLESPPGSIGAASYPARVFKGMRMAGQMGNARVKVENLQVMRVMSEKNIMIVKGAVPGAKNSYIIIEK